jgi:glutathione synthase
VIGDYLTEINITSPTGIRHIEALENRSLAVPVIDCLERKAAALG